MSGDQGRPVRPISTNGQGLAAVRRFEMQRADLPERTAFTTIRTWVCPVASSTTK